MVKEFGEIEREKQNDGVSESGEMPESGEEDGGLLSGRLPLRPPLGVAIAGRVPHGPGGRVERLDGVACALSDYLLSRRAMWVALVCQRTWLSGRLPNQ